MNSIETKLSRIAEILGESAIMINKDDVFMHPVDSSFAITFEAVEKNINRNYRGYNIYPLDLNVDTYLCIKSDKYYESGIIRMAILALQEFACRQDFSVSDEIGRLDGFPCDEDTISVWLKNILENNGKNSNDERQAQSRISMIFEQADLHLGIVSDLRGSLEETLEVVENSIDCVGVATLEEEIVVLFRENDPLSSLEGLSRNLVEEMLLECNIVYEGSIGKEEEIFEAYLKCKEALKLKESFDLIIRLLRPDDLLEYRALESISPIIKKELISKVYTDEFNKILNQEITNTIEVYFSNNLNLTDTANKLYIHRNTLLYRLEKINKATGFDLKNFEDCWKFRLAWVLNKLNL